jgi:hypothetical protein
LTAIVSPVVVAVGTVIVRAAALPDDPTPYLVAMLGGFAIGIAGHVFRSRVMVVVGILMIFVATLLLPIALDLFGERPEQPGPRVPQQ